MPDPYSTDTTSIITSAYWQRPEKPRQFHPEAKQVFGLAWYTADQWETLRQVSEDGTEMADSHRAWANAATRLLAELEPCGVLVHKIPVDVHHLIDWCRERQLPITAQTRADYTSVQARDPAIQDFLA